MEAKKYEIKTIQDIINCTDKDNVDNFLKDLKSFLEMSYMVKTIAELTGVKSKLSTQFTWIDDGKNEATLILNPKSN